MHPRWHWLVAGVIFLAAAALVPTGSVFGAEQSGGPDWCLNMHLDVDCSTGWNVVFENASHPWCIHPETELRLEARPH
jgi:hypothetical protein